MRCNAPSMGVLQLPEELHWEPMILQQPTILCLWIWDRHVARIEPRVPGDWLSTVNYHLPYERHRSLIAPSESLARKWSERWAVGNLKRLRLEYTPPRALRSSIEAGVVTGAEVEKARTGTRLARLPAR